MVKHTKKIKLMAVVLFGMGTFYGTVNQNLNVQASSVYKRTKIVKTKKASYHSTKNAGTYKFIGSAKKLRLKKNHNLKNYKKSTWVRLKKTNIIKHGKKYLYYYVKSSKNGATGWVWHQYLTLRKYKAPSKKQKLQLLKQLVAMRPIMRR
ncbi:hypothetical protein [Lactiplantibacillus carotarum]|uniref:hypothetical protein n=1 Tax=Lactiplantibacillus carotarum TaxID=2993456 RepID=UPI00298EDD2E|nr:hypothetical protein [Lactiplantibacillus carotarum]